MDDSKLRYFASAWLISITLPADSAERYNAQFVNGIDPLAFNQFVASDGDVMPGTYDVNIYINDLLVDSRPVRFSEDSAHGGLAPCLSAAEYIRYGVKIDDDHQPCFALSQTIRQAEQQLDIANHRLIIHIPQQYIEHYPRDYVSPMRFDEGINAAFVNYSYSTDANNGDGGSHQYQYLSLNSGINIASWRLRNNAYWNKFSGQADKWQSIASWAETNIIPWRSRLVVGQTSTDNSVFDSVQFRGVQLGTDAEMRPSSQTGFAPVIRGVANSNARVEVRQNNYLIYSENVPAGPFELNDISAVNRSGDFYVTVIEADGSQTTFTVAYTTLPQLVRAGQWNYQLSAGKYHDSADGYAPALMQSSLSYGLNNTFTGYIGAQYSDMDFYAGILGLAMNTSIGAFALDATQSHANIEGLNTLSGQSYRLTFSKMIEATDTSFNVAAYRFSTEDYLSLNDAAQLQDSITRQKYSNRSYASNDALYADYQRTKNQVQISLNQPLNSGENSFGSLYVSGTWQDYWNATGSTSNYNIGYNNSFTYGSYSLSLQRTYDQYGKKDDSVYLSLSIPLNVFSHDGSRSGGFSNVNMGLRSDLKGGTSVNTSAGGNTQDNKISYSVSAASNSGNYGNLNQISGYGSLNSAYGPLGLSASFGDDNSKQYSASYSGGMVLHSGGIAFAPGSIGDSDALALVKASGAKGAGIGFGSSEIGDSGYGILPYMSAYRENRVYLDISTLENDVEITNTSEITVPRSGSVVLVNFETNEGRSLILELQRTDKGFIPLGADVLNEKNESVGTVGQAGQAYVRGVEDQGVLHVVWGNDKDSKCDVRYQVLQNAQKVGLTTVLNNQQCQM